MMEFLGDRVYEWAVWAVLLACGWWAIRNYQVSLKAKTAEITKLQSELDAERRALQDESRTVRNLGKDISRLEGSITILEDDKYYAEKKLASTKSQHETEMRRLREDMELNKALAASATQGEKDDGFKLRQQVSDLQLEVLRLKGSQGTNAAAPQIAVSVLEAENNRLTADIAALRAESSRLKAELAVSKEAANKPPPAPAALPDAATCVACSQVRMKTAEQLFKAKQEEQAAKTAATNALAELERAQQQNVRLGSELETLRSVKPPALTANLSSSGSDRYLKALTNLGGNAQLLSGSQESFDSEFSRLLSTFNDLRAKLHERNSAVDELERNLKAVESDYHEREARALRAQAKSTADWTTDWLRSEVRESDFDDFPDNPAPSLVAESVGCDGMPSPLLYVGRSASPSDDFLFITVELAPEIDPSTALYVYFRVLSFPPSCRDCSFSDADYGPVSQLSADSCVLCEGGFITMPFMSAVVRLPQCKDPVWIKWSVSVDDEAAGVSERQIFQHVKANQGQFFPPSVWTRHGLSCVPAPEGGGRKRVEPVLKNGVYTLKVQPFEMVV